MNIDHDRIAVGRRIKESRTYLGLSQEEVATNLGIPRSAVSLIETGQRGIEAEELNKLSSILGRSVEFITKGKEITQSESVSLLARAAEGLSVSDVEELQRFAVFLKSRSQA
ncbi:helix-turn-helix domain-containing protein [Brevundimonas sp. P7753]|uniref:helix-turn-helix domain-containing protein n=1 Tax=Brevundimonas sp. P7753 TaxID=2726982 RepID=UPI0015BEBC2B|nr:helix-turn-helix transcriptional regulator [Brevundimonas sp. P7753]NWE51213.1 helix-turn-helix transcriptional regulator [Brevundimonas sp. P7753]